MIYALWGWRCLLDAGCLLEVGRLAEIGSLVEVASLVDVGSLTGRRGKGPIENLTHHKAAFHPQHMGKGGQMIGMKAAKIAHITRGHAQNIIALAGNQEDRQNLRDIGSGSFEYSQHFG